MNPYKIELINAYLNTNQTSKTKFCKLAKISTNTLSKIYAGNLNVGITSIFRIVRVLKIKIYEFILSEVLSESTEGVFKQN